MRKNILLLLIAVLLSGATAVRAAVAPYDGAANLAAARADIPNWMKYLPDDMYVAHVSIPGTHDTATGHGFQSGDLTGDNYSKTQDVTIDEQLSKGVRAFDFRPGLVNGYLNCNHGVSKCNITLAAAFEKLTNYLDAHPSEFFIIHLFKGNVESGDSEASQYAQMCEEFFNVTLDKYIVEFTPYLKVKDMRGKMVVLKRDQQLGFVNLNKSGGLTNWTQEFDANNPVALKSAANPILSTVLHVQDISDPAGNAANFQKEQDHCRALLDFSTTQQRPNDAKRNGNYCPYWVMNFTSGDNKAPTEIFGQKIPGGTEGYLNNAETMNPLMTNYLNSTSNLGPTGIVYSDWVLIDSFKKRTTTYNVQGVNIIPAIIEHNFRYAEYFILDDELFTDEPVQAIDLFDGKEYFMRNIGTGEFLSCGAWWGTHATVRDQGIRITPIWNSMDNTYMLKTTFRQGDTDNCLGSNAYIDNTGTHFFTVKYAGRNNVYYFTFEDGGSTKALGVVPTDGCWNEAQKKTDPWVDGTERLADYQDFNEGDSMQQWEMITVSDYLSEQLTKANAENPVDLSFLIRGHDFWPNDGDNSNWDRKTEYYKPWVGAATQSYVDISGGENCNSLIYCHHTTASSSNKKYTVWSFTSTTSNLPAGIYKLSFKLGQYDFNLTSGSENLTFTVNGESILDQIRAKNGQCSVSADNAATAMASFKDNPDNYTITLDYTFDEAGTITFYATKGETGGSYTALYLDEIRLIYYGVTEEQANAAAQRVLDVVTFARSYAENHDLAEVYDNSEVEDLLYSGQLNGEGYPEIEKTLKNLQTAVLTQTQEEADLTYGLINPSFELAPEYKNPSYNIGGSYPLGWDYPANYVQDSGVWPASDANKATSNPDGSYIFNTWEWGSAYEGGGRKLSQKINLTPGLYELKALVSSHQGNTVYIFAGNENAGHTMSGDKSAFEEVTLEFFVSAEGPVEIGAIGGNSDGSFNADGTGVWYNADNFRLTRLRNAEVIEYTPMGQYDTIILPFDVDMGDERYSDLAIWEIKTSTEHEYHVQLELGSPEPYELKANVPYIVEYLAYVPSEESEQPAQTPAMRAAAESGTITFAGVPTHTSATYTDASGMLVGSHAEQAPAAGEFVMNHNTNVGSSFTRVGAEESPVVSAHRAYISLPAAGEKVTAVVLDAEQNDKFTTTGISSIEITADTNVDVYNVSGVLLRRDVRAADALDGLSAGLYILRSENATVKAIRTL